LNVPAATTTWLERCAAEGRLIGSRCTACNALSLPPRPVCRDCRGTGMEPRTVDGTGRLVAFSSITVVPPMMAEAGYGRERPYCAGVVELDAGPRVVARIDGVDGASPETIRIGMPVEVVFGDQDGLPTTLVFRPRPG